MSATTLSPAEADRLARKLARRFRMLNWLWLGLSLLLLTSMVGVVAALWNMYVVYQRWRTPELIERRSPAVLSMYRNDSGWFLTFLLINLVLGGVVGAILIAYEYLFIRAEVRKHRQVFGG